MPGIEQEQLDLMGDLMGVTSDPVVVDDPTNIDPAPIDPVVANADPAAVSVEITPVTTTIATVASEEGETLEEINERLRLQLMEATSKLAQASFPVASTTAPITETPVQGAVGTEAPVSPGVTTQATTQALQKYLTDDELDQVIDKPELILTAINRAQQDIVQQISSNLPNVIQDLVVQQVNQQILVQQAVTEFYDANTDLRPYAQFVRFVMSEMEAKPDNKDKPYSDIFQLTADESRKRLGLKNPQALERGQTTTGQRPAFAGSKRTSTTRPAAKGDIFDPNAADMLKF